MNNQSTKEVIERAKEYLAYCENRKYVHCHVCFAIFETTKQKLEELEQQSKRPLCNHCVKTYDRTKTNKQSTYQETEK
jgi:hypothetical protein